MTSPFPPASVSPGTPFGSQGEGAAAESGAIGSASLSAAAIRDVLAVRRRQVDHFGHTPQADAEMPLGHFVREVSRCAMACAEDEQFRKDREIRRRHAVKLGAMVLALIDRMDMEDPEL